MLDFARGAIDIEALMVAHLTLYEDILSSAASALMPATPRMLFVAHSELSICKQSLWDGGIWHGESAVAIKGGEGTGATVWRFDLTRASPAAMFVGEGTRSS